MLPVIYDASHETANEYIRLHLTYTMRDAEALGLVIEHPWLPDDAGIDAAQAAVAELVELVEREKGRRVAAQRREESEPEPPPAASSNGWARSGWWASWGIGRRGK